MAPAESADDDDFQRRMDEAHAQVRQMILAVYQHVCEEIELSEETYARIQEVLPENQRVIRLAEESLRSSRPALAASMSQLTSQDGNGNRPSYGRTSHVDRMRQLLQEQQEGLHDEEEAHDEKETDDDEEEEGNASDQQIEDQQSEIDVLRADVAIGKLDRSRMEKQLATLTQRLETELTLRKSLQTDLKEKDREVKRLKAKVAVQLDVAELPPPLPIRPQDVPSDITCPVCFSLPLDPVMTPCDHCFCRHCLTLSLQHSRECPMCRTSIRSRSTGVVPLNGLAKRMYDQIAVKCPTEECRWEGMIETYSRHANRCHFIAATNRDKDAEVGRLKKENERIKKRFDEVVDRDGNSEVNRLLTENEELREIINALRQPQDRVADGVTELDDSNEDRNQGENEFDTFINGIENLSFHSSSGSFDELSADDQAFVDSAIRDLAAGLGSTEPSVRELRERRGNQDTPTLDLGQDYNDISSVDSEEDEDDGLVE